MSRHRPTVGLALIAYNEEHDLPRLLDSIEGAFDQVVLVDSYSTDATVDVFREWCGRTNQRHVVDQFEWIEDFSAKRNHANRLLNTDWACWADCDDTIENAHRLRRIARRTPAGLAALAFDYDYLFLENGECITTFARTRLVRHGAGVWVGRTHDVQIIANDARAYSTQARWVHHDMDSLDTSHERDKQILERWHADEPDNHLVTAALDAYGAYPGFDLAMRAALEAETEALRGRIAQVA
jgi:glycosyltransferase involved in cell wall biosynthesis